MMELFKVKMSRECTRCSICSIGIDQAIEPGAIRQIVASMNCPCEGVLYTMDRNITMYLELPAVLASLSDAKYIMEVGALFAVKQFYIWFAKVEKSIEETILSRNLSLQAKMRVFRRRPKVQDSNTTLGDPREQLIKEHLSSIQLVAGFQNFVTWECDGNMHLVVGVEPHNSIII